MAVQKPQPTPDNQPVSPPPKKTYHKPTLQHYGDVRDLTLSPSPQPQFESGRGFGFRS